MSHLEQNTQEKNGKRHEMFLGREGAFERYIHLLSWCLAFDNELSLLTFADGTPIHVDKEVGRAGIPSRNYYSIRHVMQAAYMHYIRRLLEETHDEALIERMRQDGISAVKVHQPPKVWADLAQCGIKEDAIHALWLVQTRTATGYLMTNNYEKRPADWDFCEGSNARVNPKALERIDRGDTEFMEFFRYDPQTGRFMKHPKNTWGEQEVAYNLAFHGLISYEEPIGLDAWFRTVLLNLEAAKEALGTKA
jgi:hypothetical protein